MGLRVQRRCHKDPSLDSFCFPPGSLSDDTCTISLFVVGLSPEQGFCFVPNQSALIRHALGTQRTLNCVNERMPTGPRSDGARLAGRWPARQA